MNRTYTATPSTIERKWYVIDAANQPVGRIAAKVAQVLRGKHKPTFTPNMDCGDFVIVINADKAVWTGNNKRDELLYWHTGYPGGIRNISRERMLEEKTEKLFERVIWGMLPKGPLGRQMHKKLKVYRGSEHPHAAQQPVELKLESQK